MFGDSVAGTEESEYSREQPMRTIGTRTIAGAVVMAALLFLAVTLEPLGPCATRPMRPRPTIPGLAVTTETKVRPEWYLHAACPWLRLESMQPF